MFLYARKGKDMFLFMHKYSDLFASILYCYVYYNTNCIITFRVYHANMAKLASNRARISVAGVLYEIILQ